MLAGGKQKMKRFQRELINGLFVLIVGSLMSTAFEAFHLEFNLVGWSLIVLGLAVAANGYVTFAAALGSMSSAEAREEEWLKRVGTPARLDFSNTGEEPSAVRIAIEALKTIKAGSDVTMMYYVGATGGAEASEFTQAVNDARRELFSLILELLSRGRIREFKRILCFDRDAIESNHELKSGILRIGQGLGTVDRIIGDHCQRLLQTKGASVYLAPAVFQGIIGLYGTEEASMSVETVEPGAGGRRINGALIFHDPPNGEIIEQLRQLERATERQMIAVREIRFPEEETAAATGR